MVSHVSLLIVNIETIKLNLMIKDKNLSFGPCLGLLFVDCMFFGVVV